MNDGDVDPEAVARAEDDFQRAIHGKLRTLPKIEGLPPRIVQTLVEAYFGGFYKSVDPENPVQTFLARIYHTRVEPVVLARLQELVGELEDIDLLSEDMWKTHPRVEEFLSDVREVRHQIRERLDMEYELAELDGEENDPRRFLAAVQSIIDSWKPDLGGDD